MTLSPPLNTAFRTGKLAYRRLTPDSVGRTVWLIIGLILAIMLTATAFMGVVLGASTAVDGEPLGPQLEEVWHIESEIWTDTAAESASDRIVIGAFHWLIVLAVWLAAQGAKLGFAIPALGYVMEYAVVLIYALWALAFMQTIRLVEFLVRGAAS